MKYKSILLALLMLLSPLAAEAAVPRFADWALADVGNQPLADGLALWTYTLRSGTGENALGQRLHVLEVAPGAKLQFLPVSHNLQVKGKN